MRVVAEVVLVERFFAEGEDVHGNTVEAWGDPEEVGIYAFNPGTTGEPNLPGHDRVITQPAIYTPPDVLLDPRDRVRCRGVVYEVDGVTLQYRNPHGHEEDGNQINLKVVDG